MKETPIAVHHYQSRIMRRKTHIQWAHGHRNPVHMLPAWQDKDFYGTEKSVTIEGDTKVKIEFVGHDGSTKVLKKEFALLDKEIIDASVLSKKALVEFFEQQIAAAKQQDVLLSLHMKATMMKVSDPVIFGHAVKVYYKDVFAKYGALFDSLGVDVNNGLGDVYAKISSIATSTERRN